jgi:hypothetical protein
VLSIPEFKTKRIITQYCNEKFLLTKNRVTNDCGGIDTLLVLSFLTFDAFCLLVVKLQYEGATEMCDCLHILLGGAFMLHLIGVRLNKLEPPMR